MRNLVYIPIGLIKDANRDNWLRSAAYFVRLKSLYKNNTHYKFTLRSLGGALKCSPAALQKHLRVLNSKGLISYHGKNITFAGLKKLQQLFTANNIGVPVDFKNQLNVLRGQIIRFNLSTQEYKQKKSGLQLHKNGFVPFSKTEKINSCYVGLSAKGVGSLFSLTQASGSRIRKKLNSISQISVNRVFSLLFSNVSPAHFKNMKYLGVIPYYSFLKEGHVLVERRTRIKYMGCVSSLQKINKN